MESNFYTFEEMVSKTHLDLEKIHYLKTLVESNKISIQAAKKGTFVPKDVRSYKKDGFTIVITIIGKDHLATMRRQKDVLASVADSIESYEKVYGRL